MDIDLRLQIGEQGVVPPINAVERDVVRGKPERTAPPREIAHGGQLPTDEIPGENKGLVLEPGAVGPLAQQRKQLGVVKSGIVRSVAQGAAGSPERFQISVQGGEALRFGEVDELARPPLGETKIQETHPAARQEQIVARVGVRVEGAVAVDVRMKIKGE